MNNQSKLRSFVVQGLTKTKDIKAYTFVQAAEQFLGKPITDNSNGLYISNELLEVRNGSRELLCTVKKAVKRKFFQGNEKGLSHD